MVAIDLGGRGRTPLCVPFAWIIDAKLVLDRRS